MKSWIPLAVLAVSTAVCTGWADVSLRVTADRVNIRARPAPGGEIVCQAVRDDVLLALRDEGDWWALRPPSNAALWVHADFLQDNTVSSRLNVRSGPGISFNPVGVLEKGDAVDVRESRGEWRRIAPPAGCTVWISRTYVTALTPAAPEPAPATNAAPPPPPPTGTDLRDDVARQGALNSWEGLLQPVESFFVRKSGSFRLTGRDPEGEAITLCYVQGNDEQLQSLVGRKIRIRGWEYWLSRQPLPVVVPETITLLP